MTAYADRLQECYGKAIRATREAPDTAVFGVNPDPEREGYVILTAPLENELQLGPFSVEESMVANNIEDIARKAAEATMRHHIWVALGFKGD